MFRDEHQFASHVVRALEAAGLAVRREVPVRGRRRLDIVAVADGVTKGIEVKFTRRGLLDDLIKAHAILRFPEVDEIYVCGLKAFMSEDVLALASKLGVGLLAVGETGELNWLAKSKKLEPARLTLNGAYMKPRGKLPFNVVRPGGRVAFNAAVFNNGEKTAVNVEVFMLAAGPFVARARSKARVKKALLERSGHTAWSAVLECEVRKGTPAGTYPLLISVTADNAARDDTTVRYEVRPAVSPRRMR